MFQEAAASPFVFRGGVIELRLNKDVDERPLKARVGWNFYEIVVLRQKRSETLVIYRIEQWIGQFLSNYIN